MSLTVVAHFCRGKASPFPSNIENIAGEGGYLNYQICQMMAVLLLHRITQMMLSF